MSAVIGKIVAWSYLADGRFTEQDQLDAAARLGGVGS